MPIGSTNTAPNFGLNTGTASFSMGFATSLALQGNGKLVLGGYTRAHYDALDFIAVRINTDGSLDTSFSGDGQAVIDVGGYSSIAYSIVVQSDGKLVLAGSSTGFSVVRLNTDGSLDTSFSGDGQAVINFGNAAVSVVVQSDDKLVLGGTSYNNRFAADFGVVRLNADGSLDTSFSGDGQAVIDLGGDDVATSMVVQSDGKVVLGGTSYSNGNTYDFSLVRLNADGSLDTSFSGDGKAVIDFGGGDEDRATSMVVQSDGKLVLAGYSYNSGRGYYDFSVLRLNADGSLDTSFSDDGQALIDLGESDYANSVVVQSDGKLVLAGYSGSSDNWDYSVVRLNADGSLDTSLSGDGKAVIDLGGYDKANSVVVQSDGKLVLGGSGGAGGWGAVVRLNADGSLDTTFGDAVGAGNAYTLGGSVAYTEQATPVILDSSVQIFDAELAALNSGAGNYAGSSITLARAGGASTQDVFSAGSGSGLSVLRESSYLAVNGTTIGRVTTNSSGTLKLTFSAAATQTLVNQTLSSIAYSNTSDAPPASVQIDWTFNDGNTTGSQGTGGALGTTGRTTVNITAVNDGPPTLANPLADLRVVAGQAFSHQVPAATFTDPDGSHTLTYTVANVDGTGLPPWLIFNAATRTFSGTPDALDLGMSFDVRVSASDPSGATASDVFTVQVTNANNAPTASNRTLTATEDTARPLTVADFGFSDVDAGNTLQSVTITRLSNAGSLKLNGTAVTLNKVISAADIGTGKLIFTPAANANGTAYANWDFKVSDGTALSASAYTMTVNVTAVRDDLTKTGTAGNDTLAGDTIDAGSYDRLSGLAGNDSLSGLAGNDTLDGGTGADGMIGGDGSDTYYVDNTGDRVVETNTVASTGGTDLVLSTLSAYTLGTNVENGRILATSTASLTGNTSNNLLFAGVGNNAINGSTGTDTVSYAYGLVSGATTGVTVSLATTAAQNTVKSGSDTLTAIENLTGSGLADKLTGSSGNNALSGGAGNDTLIGGLGNDVLTGGAGKDSLTGGVGNDIFDFNALTELGLDAATRDVITDFTVGQDKIDLSTIDANTAAAGDQAFAFVAAFTAAAGQVCYSGGVVYLNTDADTAAEYAIQLIGTVPAALTAANFVL